MASVLNRSTVSEGRRHTVDHTARSTADSPSASRSNSVASDVSHRSEPSRFSAYEGVDTSRRKSSATTASKKPPDAQKSGGGFGSWFTQDPKLRKEMKQHKEAEKTKRNAELRKEVDKLVITSKHAAAVRSKLAVDPKLRRKSEDGGNTADVLGTQNTAHLTAAQQEMRFPHSGPPALHGGHKAKLPKHKIADMPALTRIASGDENDWEDEHMKKRREEWLNSKRPDVRMRQLSEGVTLEDEEELLETMNHTVLDVQGTPIVGVELKGEQFEPKPYKEKVGRAGYQKGENGVWSKPRDGPHILHNV